MVADVRGYTRFTRERGDAAAAMLAKRFADLARDAVEARSGRVIELRGDEALAVFMSPAQAVRAAIEFQATCREESAFDPSFPLPVGIGIDAGDAIPVEDGYRGVALNMAARLCSNAGAGQVLVTRDIAGAVEPLDPDVRFTERGPASFKGFEEAIDVIEAESAHQLRILETAPAVDRGIPPELDPLTPLVDREHEMRWLRGTWRQIRRGRGRVLFVSGPAQIGKTRLAAEFATYVHEQLGTVRYAGPGGAATAVALSALDAALETPSATLLVLDDVEVAGPRVAEALLAAFELIHRRPVLVLALLRDRSSSTETSRAVDHADDRGDGHITLGPLDLAGVRGIVDLYVGQDTADVPVEAMARASAGVPGRVHEVVSDWARTEASRRLAAAAEYLAAGREQRASSLAFANNVIGLKLGRLYTVEGRDVAPIDDCPYKGLAAFDESDSAYFFGREQLVGELAARTVQAGCLGVLGASGTGKSSVVAAGLLPSLRVGLLPGSDRWVQASMRPGERPMRELEASMADVGLLPRAGGDPLGQAASGLPPDTRLILVVDQFEEIFTMAAEHERTAFVGSLTRAVLDASDRVTVILTIRGDHYGACAAFPELAEALKANHVLVGALTRDELRRAVELPARRAGHRVEASLVDALVEEVADEPGGLPLLSTALVELWQARADGWIRMNSYERTGGVRGAVARLAESSYGQLSDAQKDGARRVFLRLSTGDGDALARRRVDLTEFDLERDAATTAVLTKLTQDRLLTMAGDTVEVAHEALLREWPRLAAWLADDAQGRQLREHLSQSARDWDGEHDPSGLYRGARLSAALDWSTEHAGDLNERERSFLAASRQASEHEAERERRTNRRLRVLLAGVGFLLLMAITAGGLTLALRDRAQTAAERAERSAIVALSQSLGAQAVSEPRIDRALLLAVEGADLDPSLRARSNLLTTLQRAPTVVRAFQGTRFRINALAVSPDGTRVAVSDNAGHVIAIDTVTGQRIGRIGSDGTDLAIGPDGSVIQVANGDGRMPRVQAVDPATGDMTSTFRIPTDVIQAQARSSGNPRQAFAYDPLHDRLAVLLGVDEADAPPAFVVQWNYTSGTEVGHPIELPGFTVSEIAYAADGERLMVMGDGTSVFNTRTGDRIRAFEIGSYPAAVSATGDVVAMGTEDGSVTFLDMTTGQTRQGSGGHVGAIEGIAITADGRTVISGGDDGKTLVWDVATATVRETLAGHAGRVQSVAISPDGTTLYTGSFDTTVLSWDLTGQRSFVREFQAVTRDPEQYAYNIAVSPDGTTIAAGDTSGRVSFWDAETLRNIGTFRAGPGLVAAVSYTPDGQMLLVGGNGRRGYVRVWDVAGTPQLIATMEPALDLYTWATLSPDGTTVAATGLYVDQESGGAIAEWDVRTGRLLAEPMRIGDGELLEGGTPIHVSFAPTGTMVAIASSGGLSAVLDPVHREVVSSFDTHAEYALAAVFSPDGGRVATADFNGAVSLWDPSTGTQLKTLPVSEVEASSVAWSPDGSTIATAGGGTLRLYDVASGRQIGSSVLMDGIFPYVVFSPDGRSVVASDAGGKAWIWPVSVDSWMGRACDVANRELTAQEWQEFIPSLPYREICTGDPS